MHAPLLGDPPGRGHPVARCRLGGVAAGVLVCAAVLSMAMLRGVRTTAGAAADEAAASGAAPAPADAAPERTPARGVS
ncbi:hypothetical protein [Streptomyces sp. x-80]|uniref:hypothetical protein n=1 Tax=Streptomyces sp. x-80 TaxID=2789282 RepID=UPI00397F9661